MSDIAQEGRTILFVSHNAAAVKQMCTRCLWLRDGSLYRDGEPSAILDEYLSPEQGDLYRLPVYGNFGAEVRAISLDGNPLSTHRCVRFATPFDLSFEIASESISTNLQIMARLRNQSSDLCEFNSTYEGPGIPITEGEQVSVSCHIPSLSLLPGSYDLMLKIRGAGVASDLLSWTPVGTLEIVPNVELANEDGAQFHQSLEARPPVYCPQKWTVQQREKAPVQSRTR